MEINFVPQHRLKATKCVGYKFFFFARQHLNRETQSLQLSKTPHVIVGPVQNQQLRSAIPPKITQASLAATKARKQSPCAVLWSWYDIQVYCLHKCISAFWLLNTHLALKIKHSAKKSTQRWQHIKRLGIDKNTSVYVNQHNFRFSEKGMDRFQFDLYCLHQFLLETLKHINLKCRWKFT